MRRRRTRRRRREIRSSKYYKKKVERVTERLHLIGKTDSITVLNVF
jgi:hypothetical protein